MAKLTPETLRQIQSYYENPDLCPKPSAVCEKFGISANVLSYHAGRKGWVPAWKAQRRSEQLYKKGMDEVIEDEAALIANKKLEEVRRVAHKAGVEGLKKFSQDSPTPKDYREALNAMDLAERGLGIKEETGIKLGVDISMLSTPQVIDV